MPITPNIPDLLFNAVKIIIISELCKRMTIKSSFPSKLK